MLTVASEDLICVHPRLQVADWAEVDKLAHMKELETVYFERNPIQSHGPADYRRKLKLALPSLLQIDATLCR